VIPKECKRLAEVDFPIALVSKHSAREKSIRHGHPSTLHLWWGRRPLGACRAMLLGLLLPDPCDSQCPAKFKTKARSLLTRTQGNIDTDDMGLRKAMLGFIGDFANWDLSANPVYLEIGRGLVKAAHPEETPLVVDPFAGGGSIPLEALRLGCEAFASDLNPVACLILKVMLEDIPRHGPELAEELRRIGKRIKERAEKELAEFYPKDSDGETPIAYIWARTVRCESPNCGAEIPLMRSFWLCKKPKRKRALRFAGMKESQPVGDGFGPDGFGADGTGVFLEPHFEIFEPDFDKDVPPGTVSRAKATCLHCGTVMHPDRVRAQLSVQHGGADVMFDDKGNRCGGARLLAVVTLNSGMQGRNYRLPTEQDYEAVWKAQKRLEAILDEWKRGGKEGLCPVPDEPLPPIGTLGFRVQRYGMLQWGDLFTARQKVALTNFIVGMRQIRTSHSTEVIEPLALAITRLADYLSAQCVWHIPKQLVAHTFGRQALPITWDFCEIHPTSAAPGNFEGAVDWIGKVMEALPGLPHGAVQGADACASPLPDAGAAAWFTDPPYYDAIPYSDLSDYFLVWLKRVLPDHPIGRNSFEAGNPLSPKCPEIVQDEVKRLPDGRPKNRDFFEERMGDAFAEGRRVLKEDGIGSVVFAHKTTEGWEALLSGVIRGGWTISGSWPIATEMGARLRARDSAALATSVHLVCRPRPEDAPVGDWSKVLQEVPKRVGEWMERLENEGVRGADLVFACIGPALEIFSRYSSVETAEGQEIRFAQFLERVWEEIGRAALKEVLGTDSPADYGEDARLVALFLWALRSTNGRVRPNNHSLTEQEAAATSARYVLPYDVVRRVTQPLGIHLDKWQGRLVETRKGVVRLLPVTERASQLVEPGVAHDIALVGIPSNGRKTYQPTLFESIQREEGEKQTKSAQKRLEKETWSHLHLNTITTLDHIHKAMLFQKQGQSNALRELLFYEQHYQPEFLRLANALSKLYPTSSDEKRLLDAMLLAVPR